LHTDASLIKIFLSPSAYQINSCFGQNMQRKYAIYSEFKYKTTYKINMMSLGQRFGLPKLPGFRR